MIIKRKRKKSGFPPIEILRFLFWRTVFLREHRYKEDGPCQSLQKAGSFREYILALERDDDPSSKKCEGHSQ
jgi:hypothetical protein